MKNNIAKAAFSLLLLASGLAARPAESLAAAPVVDPQKIDVQKDFFRAGLFYFGGQPNLETLKKLKAEGLAAVINLRGEKEMQEFAATAFDEAAAARELGLAYHSLPLAAPADYAPATVDRFAEIVKGLSGPVLVHCLGCGRVSHLWMAYLVRHRGLSLDGAVRIGKLLKFTLPLEDLLGAPISFSWIGERK